MSKIDQPLPPSSEEITSISDLWQAVFNLQKIVDQRLQSPSGTEMLQSEIELRRQRDRLFPSGYFADVAWEILLDVYDAQLKNSQLSITSLGLNGGIPLTTTLRYIDRLTADGFIRRRKDPHDRRRIFIELTEIGVERMDKLFGGQLTKSAKQAEVIEFRGSWNKR